jgi:Fe-S cluster assembly ATPase SufC
MTSLSKQAKFAINKEKDGTLKPEFKKQMDDKIQEINELEDMIKQIMEMKIEGGKSKRKNIKKRKTKKKKLNVKGRKSRRHY